MQIRRWGIERGSLVNLVLDHFTLSPAHLLSLFWQGHIGGGECESDLCGGNLNPFKRKGSYLGIHFCLRKSARPEQN